MAIGSSAFPHTDCAHCGLNITESRVVSDRIFYRAVAELRGNDYTLAIILSAMGVECRIAYEFFKWKKIDLQMSNLNAHMTPTQAQLDAWEHECRRWFGIAQKLDRVSEFLTGNDFDSLVAATAALTARLREHFPQSNGVSPKHFVEEQLFRKRNAIVHAGRVDHSKSEAESCAQLALFVNEALTAAKSRKYEHTFHRSAPRKD